MTRNLIPLILLFVSLGAFAETKQPNILFCIADDWGWPHAGAYGDAVVKTPTFDRLAKEGVLFEHAYVSSPSCTPSRNAILTGQYHWRLGAGANLYGALDVKHPVYPLLLEKAGYHIGRWRKSWGPGKLAEGGYAKNVHPAGKFYTKGFAQFLDARPKGKPFCFWLGASDPHRPYKLGSGKASGMDIDKIKVPAFYPNVAQVRSDIADYYYEVQRFDSDVANAIKLLEAKGELENTIIVMTGDHGMPFPRCKTNIYDMGVRVPLAIRWGENIRRGQKVKGEAGRTVKEFVSLIDLAPTFLEAARIEIPDQMVGRSLHRLILPHITGYKWHDRSHVVYGMERHVPCRPDHSGYPMRGIRTSKFAYIRNYQPDRWPAGDPPKYGDCDPNKGWGTAITKTYILENADTPEGKKFYNWNFAKRRSEELYAMVADPDQLVNLADDPKHAATKAELIAKLEADLKASGDPRAGGSDGKPGNGDHFDKFPYSGGGAWKKPK